jgi:hypothetical protein
VALAEMLLGSTETFAFIAPIPPEQCAERLSHSVRKDMRFWDRRPLNGSVSPAGFSVRFWRNNKLPGDVRARGQFSPEAGGTRVEVALDTNRAELLLLPLGLVFGLILAEAVHQLWVAALFAIPTLAVYIRGRMLDRVDRQKLSNLIREALETPTPAAAT